MWCVCVHKTLAGINRKETGGEGSGQKGREVLSLPPSPSAGYVHGNLLHVHRNIVLMFVLFGFILGDTHYSFL